MRKGTKAKPEKDNSERWLLTYSDLMNLLLIFFIILYTYSQVDQTKYQQLASSMRSAMGSGHGSDSILPSQGSSPIPFPSDITGQGTTENTGTGSDNSEEQRMKEVKQKLDELVQGNGLSQNIDVSSQERGIVISITAQVLFDSGSASLVPESIKTIEDIGRVLLQLPGNHIVVEGHTDTDPIYTSQYASNWELSAARALNVVHFLVDKVGINPDNISESGYGERRPKVPNTTEANKALNRRVDIVILKSQYNVVQAPNSVQ